MTTATQQLTGLADLLRAKFSSGLPLRTAWPTPDAAPRRMLKLARNTAQVDEDAPASRPWQAAALFAAVADGTDVDAPPLPVVSKRHTCPVVALMLVAHPTKKHLQVAHFDGGSVVVPTGHFDDGELAVFVPEGARLPEYLLKRAGLWDFCTGYGTLRGPERDRVAWKKISGVLSHGLLLKVYNDPSPPGGAPMVVLFGPARKWSTNAMFNEGFCTAHFLGVV